MLHFKHLFLSACAATLLAAFSVRVNAQTQNFSLDVPPTGGGSLQIARVKMQFNSPAFAASPQITVGGSLVNVPSVVCNGSNGATCQALGFFGASSHIATVQRLATDKVVVAIDFKDLGATLCGSRASNVVVPIVLSNIAATSAQMASYVAPNCNQAVQRSPLKAALTTPVGFGSVGRLPLTVTLVLDQSGSMGALIPGSSETRWQRLKTAVTQFVGLWEVAGGITSGGISIEGNQDDRMGLTLFSSTASTVTLDASAPVAWEKLLKKRGVVNTSWDVVVTSLPASPGGSTSMGGGLQEGLQHLKDVPEILRNDGALVLFTDGEQNTAPCVSREGASIGSSCTITGAPGASLTLNGVKLSSSDPVVPMLTIGLGASSGPFADMLDQIAQQTAGRSKTISATGAALDLAFVDQLVQALKGNTLSLLKRDVTSIAAASSAGAPISMTVDASVQRLVIAAGWDSGRGAQIEVRRPDGTVVQPTLVRNVAGSSVHGFDMPTAGPAGIWQARLLRPAGFGGAIPYHLSAYSVEGRLSYRITESPRVGTAQPVKVSATLSWDGRPLDALPPSALIVSVERPNENLGNLLSVDTGGLDGQAMGGDSQDPFGAKLANLSADPALADRVTPKPLPTTLPMTDLGNGRYEASFDATVVGGQYRFRIDMNWNDARTGAVSRVETVERQIPVIPTPAATNVTLAQNQSLGTAQLTIGLADSLGNLVGPGYAGYLSVSAAPGVSVSQIVDPRLTGNYRVALGNIAAGTDPRVRIVYRDTTVRDAPLSQIESGGIAAGSSKYAIWGGLGVAIPHGSFGNNYKSGLAATLGFEAAFTNSLSGEATLGTHRFGGKAAAPDIDVTVLGVNGKWYFSPQPMRFFATAGIGSYAFNPGSTRFGVSAGAGAQFQLAPQWSLEGRYTLHAVSSNSPNSSHSTLLLGVRYAF